MYGFGDFLTLALDEIEHYGAHDPQTRARLRSMLTDLRAAALPEYQPLLEARLRALPARADLPA